MKRGIYKTDIEIMSVIKKSNNIRECLLTIYENKNPSNSHYKKISRLMIESGLKFKDGSVYIHPELKDFYNSRKDVKPLIKIK